MDSLSDKLQIQAARTDAIEYISYGAKTSGKIIQKLQSKGYDSSVIKAAMISLNADGYIKDTAILDAYWRHRTGAKRESVSAFCRRMSNLGINKKVLEKFTEEHPSSVIDAETVKEYLDAKFSSEIIALKEMIVDSPARQKLLQKIIRNASAHGYSYQIILDGLRAYAILLHV